MTSGANAIVIGNYLTTSGRERSKDLEMLKTYDAYGEKMRYGKTVIGVSSAG